MKKCPLNNFEKCTEECAWYNEKEKHCSISKISSALTNMNSIERNLSSIEDILNQRLRSK